MALHQDIAITGRETLLFRQWRDDGTDNPALNLAPAMVWRCENIFIRFIIK
jgi:hypothetical protein